MTRVAYFENLQKWFVGTLLLLWFSGHLPAFAADFEQPVPPDRIEALLGKAKAALRENRLTIPSDNNAVAYAQQVLNLAPGHPEAQSILRAVVARYETLGSAALDRAETVWKAEIDKAQTFQQRGSEVARNYQLPDNALAKVEERIANARRQSPSVKEVEARSSVEGGLAEIIERYLNLSDEAVRRSEIIEAEWHLNVSRDLMARSDLAEGDRQRLTQRLTRTEQRLEERKIAEAAAAPSASVRAREISPPTRSEKSTFMPPAF